MSGVALGYVHHNEVAYSWHRSVAELVARGGVDLEIPVRCGTGQITEARNEGASAFLDSGCEWLLWTDTDMGFAPDTLERLLAVDRPVVGGLTFAAVEYLDDDMGGHRIRAEPVLFKWAADDTGFVRWPDYPRDQLVQVAGTGGALILVHRSAYEHLEQTCGRRWYDQRRIQATGRVISEDLAFCARLGEAGIPIFVHTGVKSTHMKAAWIGEADYDRKGASRAVRDPARPKAAAAKGRRRKR